MTRIPEPQAQPNRPYEDQLPEGATVVGWNEDYVVWKEARPVFHWSPFNVHSVIREKISGSGTYGLTAAEATTLTGIPL